MSPLRAGHMIVLSGEDYHGFLKRLMPVSRELPPIFRSTVKTSFGGEPDPVWAAMGVANWQRLGPKQRQSSL